MTEHVLRNKVAARKMPTVKIDRNLRLDVHDLDRWIDEHRMLAD